MKYLCMCWLMVWCVVAAADAARDRIDLTQPLPGGISDSPLLNSRFLLFDEGERRIDTLEWISRRNQTDMVAALIYALRYVPPQDRVAVAKTLQRLTGKRIDVDWFRWMQWQQEHPEIKPFAGFDVFQSALFSSIDPAFADFIYPGVRATIRTEEIVWGGVRAKSGIPALTNPKLIDADQADYLSDDEWVFGVVINGDVRAYPYRIMDWHEMLNDVIGGVPVSLAYCTLCGSGILFDTRVPKFDTPVVFGSSGFLYRSNKLMFDHHTDSLWNQFTGRPVVGELAGSDLQLATLPVVTTRWKHWKAKHPQTKVLGLNTGFERDYTPGAPYGSYFASPQLMFPVATDDKRLKQKDQVFGLRISGAEKAWPLSAFAGGRVVNDIAGVVPLVIVGDLASRTVRAYRGNGQTFTKVDQALTRLQAADHEWRVEEEALYGPDGQRLSRLPGHLSYWFAWHNYLGGESLVTTTDP